MLQPRIIPALRRTIPNSSWTCLRCQKRTTNAYISLHLSTRPFTSARRHNLPAASSSKPPPSTQPTSPKDDEKFIPQPLGRPIGFQTPPQPGQNTGEKPPKKDYTGMTLSERNLAKRADIVEKWGTSYFRDFKNIRKYRSGKTFMANKSIFKKEAALYFPNFRGETLKEGQADTADVMKGKVSVVNVFSSAWGEAQVRSFTSKTANPVLYEILAQHEAVAQQIDINIEENALKAWIIKMFQFQQRLQRRKEDWGKYFVVRKGVSQRIRETIGLLNGRVGYVYLLDQECRIRWAGSADAEGTEADDLTRGFGRLVEEARVMPKVGGSGEKKAQKDERLEKGMPILVPVAFK
jgi:ATPase complex subunit ATP10